MNSVPMLWSPGASRYPDIFITGTDEVFHGHVLMSHDWKREHVVCP